MFDLSKIPEYFPHGEFRSGQKECIEAILNAFANGKKFVILEGPTGSGKSAIGMTIARFFQESYYLTTQKILQDQLIRDFSHIPSVKALKGRNAYHCNYWETYMELYHDDPTKMAIMNRLAQDPVIGPTMANPNLTCDQGVCKIKDRTSKCQMCMQRGSCPYWNALADAVNSSTCLMNFHSFLYQTTVTAERFKPRNLLIVDECLHPHTYITTDHGRVPIGKLVNQKLPYKVLSYNKITGVLEYKPIVRYLKRTKQQTYKVLVGNKVLYPTADHKIYTPAGMKRLSELKVGDLVITNELGLSEVQRQVLLGSLLGDASLQLVPSRRQKIYVNKGTRLRVRFQHGPKQFEYLDWKYDILQEHAKTEPKIFNQFTSYTKEIKRFSTSCALYDDIKVTLVGNRKSPNITWLNKINDLGLAVWFMDDGSNNNGSVRFHTEGYTLEENNIIANWLREKYGYSSTQVKSYIKKSTNKQYHYISIGRTDGRDLLNRISVFIPPQMRYKLDQDYNPYDKSRLLTTAIQVTNKPILSIEPYKQTVTYDLEVEDNHNYIAGSTIVSNCHNTEAQLMDFISLTITDRDLENISFPRFDTAREYADYFDHINLPDILRQKCQIAAFAQDFKAEERWKKMLLQYQYFLDSVTQGDWIVKWEDNKNHRKVVIKPIFVDAQANRYLFRFGEKVLLMSATIFMPKVLYESLGINPDDAYAYRMSNRFPLENRPIYFKPAGSMSFKNKQETLPKLVTQVEEISTKHHDQRGIVHTHNFEIAKHIIDNSSRKLKSRILFQEDFNDKDEMLKEHQSRKNSIIVAPAMHEGLDLKGDLSRFQIICKIPYPSFAENDQLKIRMQISQDYYDWLTALKLVQSYGRSIRSEDDWADTYILDADFSMFKSKTAKKLLPKWFVDAIHQL